MDRRLRFVAAQTMWMYCGIVGLELLGVLTFELFFIVSFIGLLVVTELTAPYAVRPRWRARLRWVIVLGCIGIGYVIARRVLSVLPSGLF